MKPGEVSMFQHTWLNVDHINFHSIHAVVFTTAWKLDPLLRKLTCFTGGLELFLQ
jgi:hypothetical protein